MFPALTLQLILPDEPDWTSLDFRFLQTIFINYLNSTTYHKPTL